MIADARLPSAVDPPHACDADCEPFLVDDACTVCGVVRTDACADCGAYSYHRDGCKSSDAHGSSQRVGPAQLAILRTVNQGRDPTDATRYEVRCRLTVMAYRLLRRGLLGLHAYNHPTVTAGGCQWYLTDAGRNALAVRS